MDWEGREKFKKLINFCGRQNLNWTSNTSKESLALQLHADFLFVFKKFSVENYMGSGS